MLFQSLESTVPRHGLSRHLDIDGLTKFNDPIQKEVNNIKFKYEQEITRLNDHVTYLSRLLSQHASACNGDVCNLEFKHGIVSLFNLHCNRKKDCFTSILMFKSYYYEEI